MQDYDRRFSKLEERFLQRFKDVESEAKRNLEMYESNAKKQVESLAAQLRNEKMHEPRPTRRLTGTFASKIRRLKSRCARCRIN